jgi:antitoxin VapB
MSATKEHKRVARVFRNGRNQAVRIPVELSFDVDEVTIERHGDGLLLRPRRRGGWREFFADPGQRLPDEFEAPEDLPVQERDAT